MKRSVLCAVAAFGPLILLGACTSDKQRSVDLLNRRLQTSMKVELADNRATVQPLADGAVVTLLDSARLPEDVGAMDNRERDPRASMVEGLLDPSLMQLFVADTGGGPVFQRQKRVDSFKQYLEEWRLITTLQTAQVLPAAATADAPAGLAVTIRVICPERTSWPGYGQGQSDPSCR
jgi:hypothetical protein